MSVTLPEPFDYAKISKPLEQRYLRKLNEKSSHLLWWVHSDTGELSLSAMRKSEIIQKKKVSGNHEW